jgi:hypothetical protein
VKECGKIARGRKEAVADDRLYCPRCEKPTEWTVEHDLRCDGDERFEFDHVLACGGCGAKAPVSSRHIFRETGKIRRLA